MSQEELEISPKKKHRGLKIFLIVLAAIFGTMFVVSCIIAVITKVAQNALLASVAKIEAVEYAEPAIKPVLDENGRVAMDANGDFNFVDTDGILNTRNFKVLQITDVHIGGGAFSMNKDAWTIKTVEDLVRRAQPDFVVVTGDITYPVLFQAGTLNNRTSAIVFADMMERLGVYWSPVFGNHDSEIYSYYNREDIGNVYANEKYKHCIIDPSVKHLMDGTSVFGVTNYVVNVRESDGALMHSLFMLDSNSYLPEDPLGLQWKYDKVHDDQIDWYVEKAESLGLSAEGDVRSTLYFHIPPKDLVDAVNSWNEHDADTANVKLWDGKMGEYIAGGTKVTNDMYVEAMRLGTTGLFVGHDHKNNASFWYDADGFDTGEIGMKFTYGMSIDYLAYMGIYKETEQRGGRMIELNTAERMHSADAELATFYNADHFTTDKTLGFITYHLPYWQDLYRASKG